jgi:hypothetical protein
VPGGLVLLIHKAAIPNGRYDLLVSSGASL